MKPVRGRMFPRQVWRVAFDNIAEEYCAVKTRGDLSSEELSRNPALLPTIYRDCKAADEAACSLNEVLDVMRS